MDDSKSDNTDELLTGIDPLLRQSELLISERDYKKNSWSIDQSRPPVVIDDIMSARSVDASLFHKAHIDSLFKAPLRLSQSNIAAHNGALVDRDVADTNRTGSSQRYEASVSAQTTPRSALPPRGPGSVSARGGPKQHQRHLAAAGDNVSDHLALATPLYPRPMLSDDQSAPAAMDQLRRDLALSHKQLASAHSAANESRTEIQRMQLTNKQLSTQLQEAKLSIQTLSIQLEQVQQECKHKENTLENLDNTLGRLVAGWKKRDSQKDQEIDNMSHQIEAKDKTINESQKLVDESKIALANAVKALAVEKTKVEQQQKNTSTEINSLKNERNQLIIDNKELAKRIVLVDSELKKVKELCSQKNSNLELVKQQLSNEKLLLEKEIDHQKKDSEHLKEEGINLKLEIQIRDEKIDQMRHEMKILEDELHKIRKEMMEKDAYCNDVKSRIKVMAEEHITTARKLEKEFQMRLQHELNASINAVNERNQKSLQIHSSNFQMKLNEQSKRHRLELERLRQVAEQEIASRLADTQETISMLRARLERSEKSVQFWQQEKESVEKARNQISTRLYEIMKLGYRGADQHDVIMGQEQPVKQQTSAYEKPFHISVPKVINPPSYVFNMANDQITQTNLPTNYFEPIKLDADSSMIPNVASWPTVIPLTSRSEVPTGTNHNLVSTSSTINSALSY